jgi:2-polyprenyl-3-methyl-5-hydroxy-6-metoxy-1,4-benzoquinol methylase
MEREAYRLMQDLGSTYWWYRARAEIVVDVVQRYLARGSRLLDFGCGAGQISTRLHNVGYDVIAADTDHEMLAVCRQAGLATCDLNTMWPDDDAFAGIFIGDVLEHVAEDEQLLRRLRRAIQPKGYLIVTVPAYDFLWSGEDHVSGHVRRYNRRQLCNQASSAGLHVVRSTYFNSFLLPAITCMLLYKRVFRPQDMYRTDVQPLPHWLNETLYRIFASERPILRRLALPAGASILLVAQRQV